MARKASGWEVPPQRDPITGKVTEGYSTRDPAAAFKPGAKPIYPSGRGGGGAPAPTPPPSTGMSAAERERLKKEQEDLARQEQERLFQIKKAEEEKRFGRTIKGQIYSKSELERLGVAGGLKRMPHESQSAWEARLRRRGAGVAYADPTVSQTYLTGGVTVSESVLRDIEKRREDLLKDIAKAGREGRHGDVSKLRTKLKDITQAEKRVGATVSFAGLEVSATPPSAELPIEVERTILGVGPFGLKAPPIKKAPIFEPISKKWEEAEKWTRKRTTYPAGEFIFKRTGLTAEKFGRGVTKISPIGISLRVGLRPKVITTPKIKEFQAGYITGGLRGLKEKPLKTGVTIAAFAVMPVAFKGMGAGAKALGITKGLAVGAKAYPITAKILRPTIKYGLMTAYGTSVGYRIYKEPTPFKKGFRAGEITTTEILPMMVGYKVGAYGLRRGEQVMEIRGVKAKLTPEQKILLTQQLKEARAFRKVQPRVKEISFKGMERIPKKARPIISEFIRARKERLIVGGTFGARTQLLAKELKPPHDVDIFFQGGKARTYTKELARQLKSVKGFKTKAGAVYYKGAKAIEFHPVETHLRSNIEQILPWYKTYRAGITKTPSGIRVLKMSAQYPMKTLGFYRYGPRRLKDILYARKVARPTLMKQAQLETVGRKVFEVPSIPTKEKGFTILGQTKITGLKPQWIKIKAGLPTKVRREVLVHELIHAKHPLWPEARVRGIIGEPEFIRAGLKFKPISVKGMKALAVKKVLYPSYPKAQYPFLLAVPSAYPIRKTPKVIYPARPTFLKRAPPIYPRGRLPTLPSFPRIYKTPRKAPYISRAPYPTPPPPPPPIFLTEKALKKPPKKPPLTFGFPDAKRRKTLREFKAIPQPQKYVPSLPATILGITAEKKPYVISKKFHFGFLPTIRPIIKKKKKKRKRRR